MVTIKEKTGKNSHEELNGGQEVKEEDKKDEECKEEESMNKLNRSYPDCVKCREQDIGYYCHSHFKLVYNC